MACTLINKHKHNLPRKALALQTVYDPLLPKFSNDGNGKTEFAVELVRLYGKPRQPDAATGRSIGLDEYLDDCYISEMPALLYGPRRVGKLHDVISYLEARKRTHCVMHLHPRFEASDAVDKLIPNYDCDSGPPCKLREGLLAQAARNGWTVVLVGLLRPEASIGEFIFMHVVMCMYECDCHRELQRAVRGWHCGAAYCYWRLNNRRAL